jgi:hypothetical protein
MVDAPLVALLLLAFALAVTMHVAIALALAARPPRWRALAAFAVPPLAPYWAWRERMRLRAGAWTAAVLVYVVTLVLASRGR